ncbi:MAG: hypothetical protein ACOYI4_09890 [Christensenellales bacterium]|jgi:hypothetical protein
MDRDCGSCKKQKTMECPNSSECYALESKPYWEKHAFKQAKAESLARELAEALEMAFDLLEHHQPNWYLWAHFHQINNALGSYKEVPGDET